MPDFYYFLLFLPLPFFLPLSISLNKLVLIVTSPMVACSASVMYLAIFFHLLELQISHVSVQTHPPALSQLLLAVSASHRWKTTQNKNTCTTGLVEFVNYSLNLPVLVNMIQTSISDREASRSEFGLSSHTWAVPPW